MKQKITKIAMVIMIGFVMMGTTTSVHAVSIGTPTKTNVTCFGGSDGTITIPAATPTGPIYEYTYDGANWGTSRFFTGVPPQNNYPCQAREQANHANVSNIRLTIVTQPNIIPLMINGMTTVCPTPGTVTLTGSNSGAGMSYFWSNGCTVRINPGVSCGTYTVTIVNSLGCSVSATKTVACLSCDAPTGMFSTSNSAIGSNHRFTAHWLAPANGCHVSYSVMVAPHGSTSYVSAGPPTTNTTYLVQNLSSAGSYDWVVMTNCKSDLSSVSAPSAISTATALRMEEAAEGSSIPSFITYPNPANDHATVVFTADKEEVYSIRLIDITGRELAVDKMVSSEGENQYQLNLSGIAKGIYVFLLSNAEGAIQSKVVVQ